MYQAIRSEMKDEESVRMLRQGKSALLPEKNESMYLDKRFNRRLWPWMVWIAVAALFVLSLSAAGIFITKNHSQSTVWTDCGGTPEEARRRGCSFDMLSHAWVPRECYDQQISDSYSQAGKWEYYLDRAGKYAVPVGEVARGETDVWLREHQHYVHCTYMWRQMHRAFTVLHYIDSHLNNYNHTKHCQKLFLEKRDGALLEVLARVIYPECHPV
jgi:hypothetical protein